MERSGKLREGVDAIGDGHRDGRRLDARADEFGCVLETRDRFALEHGERPDGRTPEFYLYRDHGKPLLVFAPDPGRFAFSFCGRRFAFRARHYAACNIFRGIFGDGICVGVC